MTEPRAQRTTTRRKPIRTCVGCGKAVEGDTLLRLVVGPDGEVFFDLAGHAFGHGAHVHPAASCFSKASKGLSRVFRKQVTADAATLCRALRDAADRRVEGLLSSAARAGGVEIGFDAVEAALRKGELPVVVVATDAGSCASSGTIRQAIAEGRAVAWGTRAMLGALVRRPDVAVLGIRGAKIAAAVATTCRAADSARSVSEVR